MKKSPSHGRKVGLKEIAAEANVSIATVSRVLNGNNRVDPAIQMAVLDVAAKFDLDLLQRNKANALAFLLSNRVMLHPFHSRILSGAEGYCAVHGWDIVFLSFNYSLTAKWDQLHLPKILERRDVIRAAMVAGTNSGSLIELLEHEGMPYVALGNNVFNTPPLTKGDLVFSDESRGAGDMTRYLLGLGHRDIWFVGNTRLPWFARCFGGYGRAMDDAGLPPHHLSVDSEDDAEVGYIATKSLVARGERVTAIFAGNDATAHGVYKGLRDCGLRIPDDISVAGCDDTVGEWLYPGLTTIREFPEQLGKQMAELILNRIAKPGLESQEITVPTELIKRESCQAIAVTTDEPAVKAAPVNEEPRLRVSLKS
jgi:DNA-binding LacI/PurR family transcriptional regulator